MTRHIPGYATIGIMLLPVIVSGAIYTTHQNIAKIEKTTTEQKIISEHVQPLHLGKYILINLNQMTLELHNGTTTITSIPIISKGKPGSYYETIGGSYKNDYKEYLHFSSIGHVYMPYSVHIFGNFFIHGIPYHEDGTKVSSAYSGGCIRVADNDAKKIYDFTESDTQIIITQNNEYDFEPTNINFPTIKSEEMTRFMVAIISLEFLTQDNEILNTDNTSTTRRAILSRLLKGDDTVADLYVKATGKDIFIENMNKKAKALGLTNTTFTDIKGETETTEEELKRFMKYVDEYESYLKTDTRI